MFLEFRGPLDNHVQKGMPHDQELAGWLAPKNRPSVCRTINLSVLRTTTVHPRNQTLQLESTDKAPVTAGLTWVQTSAGSQSSVSSRQQQGVVGQDKDYSRLEQATYFPQANTTRDLAQNAHTKKKNKGAFSLKCSTKCIVSCIHYPHTERG